MSNPSTVDRRDVAPTTNPLSGKKEIEQDIDLAQPLDKDADQLPAAGRIANSGSDPDTGMRRTGGTPGDPHGGHEHAETEWHGTEPNPNAELVPGGSGAVPPSSVVTERTESLAYTAGQEPNLSDGPGAPLVSDEQPVEGAENKLHINPVTKRLEIVDPPRTTPPLGQ
jgi:hypothetical protein